MDQATIFERVEISQTVGLHCTSLCSYSQGFCAASQDGTVLVVAEGEGVSSWQVRCSFAALLSGQPRALAMLALPMAAC
jgi:hypothetical protein